MIISPHVFTHPGTGLAAAVKHYERDDVESRKEGLTLIFAHGISFHKELWEPIIEQLFALDRKRIVRDAWCLDWQSHGESGLLNKHVLATREPVSTNEYADLLAFFSSSLARGCHIVAVGHSASTSAWVLAAAQGTGSSKLISVILIEPVVVVPPIPRNDPRFAVSRANRQSASSRPFTWPSVGAAVSFLTANHPWRAWDPRVLGLYIDHGLIVSSNDIVSTRCTKQQECGVYEITPNCAHITAGEELARLCARVPVHVVFGERPSNTVYVYPNARKEICDAQAGRCVASIQVVPGTGHLVSLSCFSAPDLVIEHSHIVRIREPRRVSSCNIQRRFVIGFSND
ncbi:Alpha/beta hydrolase fold-1 [Vararia minispora EC-137]|uniref:Alpha/beta hydrolase fold-1 n=1 Tax=Vararia minispora EC-137 TaxID=1314806 RepID=A0ACB8QC06_9AGAM|nr:Alpha/beta hydrolase fold-1 [Vararia minispora EC-137]